jgi:hypothetical protein
VVIPRICSFSILPFPFILFPIVVLHQLGIRANFPTSFPHCQTTIIASTTRKPTTFSTSHNSNPSSTTQTPQNPATHQPQTTTNQTSQNIQHHREPTIITNQHLNKSHCDQPLTTHQSHTHQPYTCQATTISPKKKKKKKKPITHQIRNS